MRVIITGSRSIDDPTVLEKAIADFVMPIGTVITGGDKGIEALARDWAKKNNVSVELYRANFRYLGDAAQRSQSEMMIRVSEGLIAIWDGKPKRIKRLLEMARDNGLRVYELKLDIPDKFGALHHGAT